MLPPDHELALALLLWRAYRSVEVGSVRKDGEPGNRIIQIQTNMEVSDAALEMAKRVGVGKLFLELLFQIPVMTIEIKELEEWEKQNSNLQDAVSLLPHKIEKRRWKRYAERRKPSPKKDD